ncbi:MAG TPA: Rne/Rng family ribonuclease, partial [Thermoanaerobaculia bacterium]|nr:Rne/Rng family ribonuclease [Thermoanaerobaculia bacterium]
MARKMLINAQRPEELRVAIVSGSHLESYQVEVATSGLTRGNIYRGLIANIQPALNAAFIDYGGDRHGFLAIQDVVPEAYYHSPRAGGKARIEEVLDKARPIVVQVTREPEGGKGAALTTNLSLAGRYLVLTPFDDTRGVSRKVEDEEARRQLKELAGRLELPSGCGAILRTNALDQTKATLGRDLAALLRIWKRVQAEARQGKGTRLLYSDQGLILQALRDHLDSSIDEVLVDDDDAHEEARAYLQGFAPRTRIRLERYTDRVPLFSRYGVEPQVDRIYERTVQLPGGGSIVIDRTEALTAIDVNSGRGSRGANQEETALQTNLEAANEVARQLRLRDLGGLVVVDFIDMRSAKYQRNVEKELKEAMKADRARSTVGRISPNGLLEINRQRVQQALQMRTHRPCPTCAGTGRIASPEMVGLNLLRRIEERAAAGSIGGVRVELHPELADAFQNSRRREIAALEEEFGIRVEVIASPRLHRPQEEVEWLPRDGSAPPPKPRAPRPAVTAAELAEPEPAVPGPVRAAAPREDDDEPEEDREKRARRRRGGRGRRKRGPVAPGGEP